MQAAHGIWQYVDTGRPVADDRNRACGCCGGRNTTEGHDHCLGTLPGVISACCGHGVDSDAYVLLENGSRMGGTKALKWVERTNHDG